MKIDNIDLIREFYELNQHKYPLLTFEEFRVIVSAQYIYVKENMESGKLPTIRLKYLGVFIVFQGRARGLLNTMNELFKNLKVEPVYYFKRKAMLEDFLLRRETAEDEDSDTEVD